MDITKIYDALSKYQIYHEAVHENVLNPIALIWNTISKVVLDMPFDWMKWQALFVDVVTNLLNISQGLGKLQHDLLIQTRSIFLGFIGGTQGKIALASGAGMLLILMVFYLIYQYINGKGKFMHALFHLLGVVMTMFFFFGNFTYTAQNGQRKTDMGGQILFNTVSNVSSTVQQKINLGLMGYSGESEKGSSFVENYVVKPAANFINTGNPSGVIGHDSKGNPVYFDYDAANGKKKVDGKTGQKYVDAVSKEAPFLKNDGKNLGQQIIGGFLCNINLLVYAIPLIVINVVLSVISLFLCLLVLLIPVSALLSFVPWFRNAFYSVVRYCLGLVVAPSVLSAFAGVLFYLMMRIDFLVVTLVSGNPSTTNLEATLSTLNAAAFLAAMPAIVLLKIVFVVAVFKSRKSLVKEVTGGPTPAFGDEALRHLQAGWHNMQNIANKAQGTAEVAAGATTGNPSVALDGASKLSVSDQERGGSPEEAENKQEMTLLLKKMQAEEQSEEEIKEPEDLAALDPVEGENTLDEDIEEPEEGLEPQNLQDFMEEETEDQENEEITYHLEEALSEEEFAEQGEENTPEEQVDQEEFQAARLEEIPTQEGIQEGLPEEEPMQNNRLEEKQEETQRDWQEAMEYLEEMRD